MTGSPIRLIALRKTPATDRSVSSTLPVKNSAQVEAFTNGECAAPRCLPQSEGAILSSISVSIVSASGTRNKASARHINATPSSVLRLYSARKTSIKAGRASLRRWSTNVVATASMRARFAGSGRKCSRCARTSASGAYVLSRMI